MADPGVSPRGRVVHILFSDFQKLGLIRLLPLPRFFFIHLHLLRNHCVIFFAVVYLLHTHVILNLVKSNM